MSASRVGGGGFEVFDAFVFIPQGIKKKDMESNTSESHHVC